MYLADRDLRNRLAEINIETGSGPPFDPDQVQPCSIDMRLSNVYWRPGRPPAPLFWRRGTHTIDFHGSRFTELNPRRHWQRRAVEPGETITLRPGEMVLGRTHEVFTVPDDCAAIIEGRSSYARMGLAVHMTGSFINPGWRGHMPLTLVNLGRFNLRIPAYLSLCQVVFVKLTQSPETLYGRGGLQSKYIDDDGGPSYWWRDRMLSNLLAAMGRTPAGLDIQTRLLERVGSPSDEVLERLEQLVQTQAYTSFGNVDELLLIFAKREDRRRMRDRVFRAVTLGVAPIMIALTLASFFERPYEWLHYAVWGVTLLSIPVSLIALRGDPGEYLGTREQEALEKLRRDADEKVA